MAYFRLEIIEIKIHLTYVTMFYISSFKVYQYIAFQYAMIEHQIHLELSTSYPHYILSTYECKATPEFKKELLHVT